MTKKAATQPASKKKQSKPDAEKREGPKKPQAQKLTPDKKRDQSAKSTKANVKPSKKESSGEESDPGKKDKSTQPMDLPDKRPKVADAERTARAERLQKQVNQRRAKNRLVEVKQYRKARDRREKVVRVGRNSRQIRRPDVRKNTQNNWWNTQNRVTNNDVRIRNTRINTTTVINRNFERNVNWTTRRQDWGYNPWWNRRQTRP